uniref:Transmembrane protein 234 n=1 Tax=Pseudictyota dubia TaxID=2749911 RepID=A0A7R9W2L4_9STRA|mmetsp:Transcript_29465/g.54667  ORF Transcript_29465/g.54667 Transcript_29465/m.54667 type:complete len:191 (+) Transcript_29465:47-619(+)
MAVTANDLLSAILVGALWGCTNPLLRRGSAEAKRKDEEAAEGATRKKEEKEEKEEEEVDASKRQSAEGGIISVVRSGLRSLLSFRRLSVLLPYLLNQSGSLLFYKLLATSDLTVSVPVCNALALLFSVVTSFALGERVDSVWRTLAGSALVTAGVSVCALSSGAGGGDADGDGDGDGEASPSPSQSIKEL